jgi:hypothetical protein
METKETRQDLFEEGGGGGGAASAPAVAETVALTEKYDSVQFSINGHAGIYQFKIRCLPQKGDCILVREDSEILANLKAGAVLDMAYYHSPPVDPADELTTRVDYISHDDQGRFKGHQIVGLSVLAP